MGQASADSRSGPASSRPALPSPAPPSPASPSSPEAEARLGQQRGAAVVSVPLQTLAAACPSSAASSARRPTVSDRPAVRAPRASPPSRLPVPPYPSQGPRVADTPPATAARSAAAADGSSASPASPGHVLKPVAEPALGPPPPPAAGAGVADADNDDDDDDDDDDMAPRRKTSSLLSRSGRAADSSPYGSVQPSAAAAAAADNVHQLRRVGDTVRSRRSVSSWRSYLSRQSSRMSDDLDGAALVSGLAGRFGLTEAPLAGELLEQDKDDASGIEDGLEDGLPLDYDDLSLGSDDGRRAAAGSDDDDAYDDDAYDNSPHEAVRAAVPPTDNTTLSINTPRMWCLSVLFSILGSSTNLFFSLRYPSVAITPVIALLLVHPLGHLWDYALKRPADPDDAFVDGVRAPAPPPADGRRPRGSWRRWLAQGRWNEKEHTCVYVSSNVAFGFAFATDVIVEQTRFYNQAAPVAYQLLLTVSTQILGYGFAGMARRFLVRPSGMIWPGTLMSAAMFSTLHTQDNKPANGWTISRWAFFVVWGAAFAFYFLPGLLFPALSYFNVLTWFAPDSVVVASLFGVASGLGLFPMTFDWAQVTYVGSPLLVPFWAAVNVIAGLAVVMWITAPILYYANVLYSSYMPILSAGVFDNTGHIYDVSRILTPDFLFDRDAYARYSRVFLPITYVLSYGVQFAGLASLLTHTLCWHGHDIWRTWKRSLEEARHDGKPAYQPVNGSRAASSASLGRAFGAGGHNPSSSASSASSSSASSSSSSDDDDNFTRMTGSTSNVDGLLSREDVHCRLMRRYKDAPVSWYLLTFASMAAIGMFVVEYYPVHLPWYGLLLALGIGAIFFIPNGIIMAVTNQHSSIYLICQLICGVVFPGRPIANMVFVTYGYISSAQGIKFASDLKLGHYMKTPPRIMFLVQVVATLVSSLTQIGVLNWMFANVRGICTPDAVNGFTCPIARVHFNGSILWGVVGPGEFFGPGAIYRALVWAFPLGALLPIPLWLYARRRRRSLFRKVNFPVIFGAMSWIPPATGLNFSVWALVCFVFNYLIKRRASAWWAKYTMTLSAALDSGLAFGIVVVFFGFVYPDWMNGFRWWGTDIYKQGCDWKACSYRTVADGETFGPDKW